MRETAENFDVMQLILRVKNGDESAFAQLLSKYTPLIESAVAKSLGTDMQGLYADDFRQEATVTFYNAILAYDVEQHEVEFGLYAKICIANALISQLRLIGKRSSERLSDSSEECLFVKDSEDPSAKILEQESLRSLYSVIRGNLSEFEYRVWQMYMSGKSARQIGLEVGKDEKSVSNAIYRIRRKLRAVLH
jgi:RNA polymerase sporulation-specific sigma factor